MHVHRVTDRTVAAVLTLLGACGVSVALADPPAAPDTTPAATAPAASATSAPATSAPAAAAATSSSAASAPAAPAAAATANAASAADAEAALEKRLTNAGYKPKMRNGTKVWCKRQDELGSRLGAQEVCGTPDELVHNVQRNQDFVEQIQKVGAANNPSGK
jgi:hypothetical protein